MKYVILVYGSQQEHDAMAGETASIGDFLAGFNEELRKSGEFVEAQGLTQPALARRIELKRGVPVVTDGPFAETQEVLAGYWVVDCASLERATEIAVRLGSGPGGDAVLDVRALDGLPEIDLTPACATMAELVRGVRDDQLTRPTPCDDYDVAALIGHIDQVVRGLAAPREPSACFEDGWRESLGEALTALGQAWSDPAAWTGSSRSAGLDLPNRTWGRIVLTELVVHGWDLAEATGAPFALPGPTLRACLEHVAEFVPDAPVPALWGPAIEVPADAPMLDRILGTTGRKP